MAGANVIRVNLFVTVFISFLEKGKNVLVATSAVANYDQY